MKQAIFGAVILLLCSCKKTEATPSNSIEGKWNWIATSKDSTFYEDTASLKTQLLDLIDYKNMEWKRNDTVFYSGYYSCSVRTSELLGTKKMILKLSGVSPGYLVTNDGNTLWLQEDKTGGYTFRFLKD